MVAFLKFDYQVHKVLLFSMLAIAGFACRDAKPNAESKPQSELHYAKRFGFEKRGSYTILSVFGHRSDFDTTSSFLLSKNVEDKKYLRKGQQFVQIPCKNIASLSSIYSAMLSELGAVEAIGAIDNIDYVNDSLIIQKFRHSELRELARGPKLDLEKCLQMQPDMLFMFGMGETSDEIDARLFSANIPVALVLDHLEEHPLARAEWIKFFGAFVNCSRQADSIFNVVEAQYLKVAKQASLATIRPSVFSELKFGDIWYMPGGKSFMAILIRDAGGKYLWDDNQQTGSLPLNLEQVLAKAGQADYWLNQPLIFSKGNLLKADERYAYFKAFKENHIYNNTKNRNEFGYGPYWESGMIHPERILSDLFVILHPELNAGNTLNYYEQLK